MKIQGTMAWQTLSAVLASVRAKDVLRCNGVRVCSAHGVAGRFALTALTKHGQQCAICAPGYASNAPALYPLGRKSQMSGVPHAEQYCVPRLAARDAGDAFVQSLA